VRLICALILNSESLITYPNGWQGRIDSPSVFDSVFVAVCALGCIDRDCTFYLYGSKIAIESIRYEGIECSNIVAICFEIKFHYAAIEDYL
jgi:hypothetical protein